MDLTLPRWNSKLTGVERMTLSVVGEQCVQLAAAVAAAAVPKGRQWKWERQSLRGRHKKRKTQGRRAEKIWVRQRTTGTLSVNQNV